MNKEPKMRYCFNCGEELGRYNDYDRFDHCGERECAREAYNAHEEMREQAHEELDRQLGYGNYY